jgi:hypothetical protein
LELHLDCVEGTGKRLAINTRRQGRVGSMETVEYHAVMAEKIRRQLDAMSAEAVA